jgi:HSP20 family protein
MKNYLLKLNDLWDSVPTIFDEEGVFGRFPKEISNVINGRSDFEEENEKYFLKIEMPGVKNDEVDITLKDEILTVSWSRKTEKKDNAMFRRYEMAEGSFKRSFRVEGADPEKVDAKLKDGILNVEIAKKEEQKTKEIKVKVA